MSQKDSILMAVVYVIGCVWLILFRLFNFDITLCPFKWIYHIPCPGCGMTRAASLLMDGEMIDAVKMNPNIFIVSLMFFSAPIILIVQWATRFDILQRIDKCLGRKSFLIPFAIFEMMVWGYNIYRGI